MPADPSARHPRIGFAAACGVLAGIALAAGACTSPAGPARSPLDDRGPAPTAPPGVTSFPPPFLPPTLTPTPPASATVTPSTAAGDREAATGAAIEALAERMAISATRLTVVRVDAVDWPDGCLGVALPGRACTQVITPGFRVLLRYDTGSTHEMRTGRAGALAWVAQTTMHATVQQPELVGAALRVMDAGGQVRSVLLAPGTERLDIPVGSLRTGDRVVLGVDDVRDGSPLRAVWIAREG
ncbi:MAG: hypothetical protein WC273_03650 [Dehalococcoidia bacterium]